MADLLDLLAANPGDNEIHVEASRVELPRFAVFGPGARAEGDTADTTSALEKPVAVKKFSDSFLVPLSNAAKAPSRHEEAAAPGGMDARWWGVALSLGILGLLLVGFSLASLRL